MSPSGGVGKLFGVSVTAISLIVITAFVIVGYSSYVQTTVLYYGMIRSDDVFSTATSIALLSLSAAAIFIRRGSYLPKTVAWVFNVLANASYAAFYEMRLEILVISSITFIGFCLLVGEGVSRPGRFRPSFINLCFWVTVVASLYFFARNGFKFDSGLLLFKDVYDVRFEVTGGRNALENIIFSTTTKLFATLALATYTYERKYIRAAIICASIVLMYSTSAQKSIMFFMAVTLAISFPRTRRVSALVGGSVAGVILLLTLIPVSAGSPSWLAHSFLTRRLLLIPAWLNESYFRYYDGKPLYLTHSILNGIVGNYSGPGPTWEMGRRLWGLSTSLNNGLLSDGFLNFGIIGSVAFAAIGYFVVSRQARMSHPAARSCTILYIWQMTNSALITTFVTHGLLLFVVAGHFLYQRRYPK